MMKSILATSTAALALAAAAPASAAVFYFTFANASLSGAGTFTTADTANSGGGYAITATTGSLTNGTATFAFTGPTGYLGADNLLFADAANKFSIDGTSFTLSNGVSVNLYYSSTSNTYRFLTSSNAVPGGALTSFTLTPAAAAVPETATWAMMLAGFALVGAALRRRSVKVAFA